MPSLTFEAIGTGWQIDSDEPLDPTLVSAVHERIEAYDRTFSRFRPDSVVSAMAQAPGSYALPPEADALIALYTRLGELTDGAVNPLVGASLEHLGYDAGYSLRPAPGHRPAPGWDEVCSWDGELLVTDRPVVFDVGAAGKGQLVDLVTALLADVGIGSFTVDAGGDMAHRGAPALRVGLESPFTAGQVIGAVAVADGAICGSAPNRRSWGPGLHHVLDARTGSPTSGVAATWAVAGSAMVADGAATALFFAGPDQVAAALGVDAVVVRPDGSAQWSAGFPGEVFT